MRPLVEELIPCPDPWDVARKLSHLPNLLFLDSSELHAERGRYSYVMADPVPLFPPRGGDPFEGLDYRFGLDWSTHADLPPFQGGIACLLGYQLCSVFENIRRPAKDFFNFPDCQFGVYGWVVAFDHLTKQAWIISSGFDASGPQPRFDPDYASRKLDAIKYTLIRERKASRQTADSNLDDLDSNFTRDGYLAAVGKAIDYIRAGDAFQINLSQRLLIPRREHPLELYGRLRKVSPAPFSCYYDAGDYQVLSASPERFLKVSPAGEVVTQPIKGTRPRGKTPEQDAALIGELTSSAKDRAENVMIVDLLRNDLGRVCEYGSIHVPRVCDVESYSYVHHLVSEVRGKLRKDQTAFDLLRACFPGGSVTGAPKVRAMEIIAELEPTARGPYCGSIGFIGFDGAMDSNILIRTITASDGQLQFPVGGGIVADSDPETEYQETLYKAAGLLRALRKN